MDWPEQSQTSPTRTSRITSSFTSRRKGPPGCCGGRRTNQFPLRISFSIIMLSTKTYSYFLSGRSPAPYFQFRITLQHHFVTYQTRKSDFSRKRQRSRTNQQNKANNKKYPFHIYIRIIYRSKLDNPSDTDHQVRNTFFNKGLQVHPQCYLFFFFYVTPPLKFIISAPQTAEYIVI